MLSPLLLVALLSLLNYGEGKIYGIVTDISGDNTLTIVETVAINPSTGDFDVLAQNIIYVGGSVFVDGIAAFDQKYQRLYFTTDFDSDFVYGVDVSSGAILPPISINSESIENFLGWVQ